MTYRLPIDLEKAGRLYVYDTSDNFRVYAHAFGNYEIECGDTGETVYLQGEDGVSFERDLEAVEAACGNLDLICDYFFGNG